MERKPLSTGSIVGAVVLLVVVLLGLYVGGYFALGSYQSLSNMNSCATSKWIWTGQDAVREYPYDWQATSYRPLAHVECAVTGKKVALFGPTKGYDSRGYFLIP